MNFRPDHNGECLNCDEWLSEHGPAPDYRCPVDDTNPAHVRWFGPTWHAPICEAGYETAVPVGEACIFCHRVFEPESQGIYMNGFPTRQPAHIHCLLDNVGVGADVAENPFIKDRP